jgi:hypothetical protein
MAIVDLYSKRRKRALGQLPDIVSYNEFPPAFRNQLCYLIYDALGDADTHDRSRSSQRAYEIVVEILRREHGRILLTATGSMGSFLDLHAFVRQEMDVDLVLDAVELVIRVCEVGPAPHDDHAARAVEVAEELNVRFKEHGLGYQYESGEIIRTDSRLLHEEAVRPALMVLSDPDFKGAEEEFFEAFEHHSHGREKDALTWALKALESTLKVIRLKRGWPDTGQAKDLLATVFKNNLIEPMWQSEFSGLRSVLESGVPTGRNKLGGHGQGAQQVVVPGYLAAFVLHQAAAAVLFLVEAHKAKP